MEIENNDLRKSNDGFSSLDGWPSADVALITVTNQVVRIGWEEAFQRMHKNGDDCLLINDVFNDENLEEWN